MALTKAEQAFFDAFMNKFGKEEKSRKQLMHPHYSFGRYIVDFYFEPDIAIEIDGKEHWLFKRWTTDYPRERYLIRQGLVVVRFTNKEVLDDPEKCVDEFVDCFANFEIKYLTNNKQVKDILETCNKQIRKANLFNKKKASLLRELKELQNVMNN